MFVVYETFTGEKELFLFTTHRENAILLSGTKFSADNYAACYIQDMNLIVKDYTQNDVLAYDVVLIQDVDYDYVLLKINNWSQFSEYLVENMENILDVCLVRNENQLKVI